MADKDDALVDAEEVWAAITSQFEKLQGDIVCVIPDPKLKNKLKEKFKSHEGPLKSAFTSKMEQFVKANESEPGPESGRKLVEVNTRDLRENLAAEWVDSLQEIVQLAKKSQKDQQFDVILDGRLEFLTRKVQSSIDGFEGGFASRFQQQAGGRLFGPMDFNRESLEADPLVPADTEVGITRSQSQYAELEAQMDALKRDLANVRDEAADKTKRIVELNENLILCNSLSIVLGCNPSDLERETHKLVTATAAQNSQIDALQKQLTELGSLQDHADCKRRINDLQADINHRDTALQAQLQRVVLLSQTIKDLRDELHVQSIRRSFGQHVNESSEDVDAAADSASAAFDSSVVLFAASPLLRGVLRKSLPARPARFSESSSTRHYVVYTLPERGALAQYLPVANVVVVSFVNMMQFVPCYAHVPHAHIAAFASTAAFPKRYVQRCLAVTRA